MFCPRCGNQQVSDDIRFCVKCGLSLGSSKLLLHGVPDGSENLAKLSGLSPRAKGIVQGIAIIPVSIGALFLLDIFYETVFGAGIMGGIYAMFTLILLTAVGRVIYALKLEEGRNRTTQIDSGPAQSILTTGALTTEPLADKTAERKYAERRSVIENTTHRLELDS